MTNADFVGDVIFSQQLSARTRGQVEAAAEAAGIDAGLIRDLNDKYVFVRAMNELKKREIVAGTDGALKDKLVDDQDTVAFQFNKRFVESHGAHYEPAGIVKYSKETGAIWSESSELEALAKDLFGAKKLEWTSTDINGLCHKVVESEAKRIMLRHGVWFVPKQAKAAATKVKAFLSALNLQFFVLPIHAGDENAQGVNEAVTTDIKKEVESIREQIAILKADGSLTKRKANHRIKELRQRLEQYKQIAQATQRDLSAVLAEAGEAGKILLEAADPLDQILVKASQGRHCNPLVADLIECAEELEPGSLHAPQRPSELLLEEDGEEVELSPVEHSADFIEA